jgi:serine phosphatase RsbU (regulator of sigma subunit)
VFTSNDVRLGRGDLAVLLTDGLFEVFDSKDRDLGIDAIAETLEAVRDLPLEEVSSRVFARAKAFGAQLDDQTILLMRGA